MAKFRINYSKVISQANSMDDLAEDLQDRISQLNNLLTSVRKDWVGPASTSFQGKLSSLIGEIRSTKTEMTSVASKIRSTASSIQREDERLAREAEEKL